MANLFIQLFDNQYVQNGILVFKQIIFVISLILVIIGSIFFGFTRRKQTTSKVVSSIKCDDPSINSIIEQQEEEKVNTIPMPLACDSESNQIDNSYREPGPEVPIIASNACCIGEENIERSLRMLTCYCDGSYSYRNQIGYSGFRTSNGFSKYRRCPLRHPRSGSTESEVFAACLALEYAAEHHYDILILYTDNTKVEQLLKRPKAKDYNDYPAFSKALEQCREKDGFNIHVKRVRGHTTWYEQQQCSTKREFAKVDRQVRRNLQKYQRQYNSTNSLMNTYPISYSYRCNARYIQVIYTEQFDYTLIITSNQRVSTYF